MASDMTVGQRIQQARKAMGLSQVELGQKLGVSGSMIGQWENDLRNPKPETLQRISAALNVDFYSLASWDQATKTLEDRINAQPWGVFLDEKLAAVGCSIGFYEPDAYIWINYPDGTLEVTEAQLKELDQSTDSFLRFKLQELREQHPGDFRPKRKRPQPSQSVPESPPPAREDKDTTLPSDTPETLSESE